MPFLAKKHLAIPTKDLISWIFDDAIWKYNIDEPIYIDAANPKRSISCRQARKVVRQVVAGLRAAGMNKGDTVTINAFNDIYYPMLFLGIIASGCVFAGANPSYTSTEHEHHFRASSAKMLISEIEILPPLLSAAKSVGIPQSRILLFDHDEEPGSNRGLEGADGYKSWRNLLQHGEQDWVRFDDIATQRDTVAALLFSSGTTGLPKAAQLTHRNLIAQHVLVHDPVQRPYPSKRLNPLPLFHAAVAPVVHTSALHAGWPTYMQRRFEVEPFLRYMHEYSIPDFLGVPPVFIAILNRPDLTAKYPLKSVRGVTVGAAPLDKDTQARFGKLLAPGTPCTQVWGMTELACIATQLPWPETDETGSVGRPIANIDLKLVDDEGRDVSELPDVPGEICVRGPTLIKGYVPTTEGVKANETDWDDEGYFHTGDVARRDEKSGLFYIVDRKKELIKVRAFQVAPSELEGVVMDHPAVADAAVIGIQMPGTELPRAYVVKKPGNDALTEDQIKQHVASRVARYKKLDGGVSFIDGIPRNASGKILRRVLRDVAKKEMGGKAKL